MVVTFYAPYWLQAVPAGQAPSFHASWYRCCQKVNVWMSLSGRCFGPQSSLLPSDQSCDRSRHDRSMSAMGVAGTCIRSRGRLSWACSVVRGGQDVRAAPYAATCGMRERATENEKAMIRKKGG